MLSTVEKDSLTAGNLLVIGDSAIPSPMKGCESVYFVWYRPEDSEQYRILLKTFKTQKKIVTKSIPAIRDKHPECGLGKWNMLNGKFSLYQPKKAKI